MVRRSPLARNSIVPSCVAKIVSSRPIPVPGPGRKRVPRWRTMIIPAFTSWPANIFTPSIFGFESRPLRDEPSPFLCAMSYSAFLVGFGFGFAALAALVLAAAFGLGVSTLASVFADELRVAFLPIVWISTRDRWARK